MKVNLSWVSLSFVIALTSLATSQARAESQDSDTSGSDEMSSAKAKEEGGHFQGPPARGGQAPIRRAPTPQPGGHGGPAPIGHDDHRPGPGPIVHEEHRGPEGHGPVYRGPGEYHGPVHGVIREERGGQVIIRHEIPENERVRRDWRVERPEVRYYRSHYEWYNGGCRYYGGGGALDYRMERDIAFCRNELGGTHYAWRAGVCAEYNYLGYYVGPGMGCGIGVRVYAYGDLTYFAMTETGCSEFNREGLMMGMVANEYCGTSVMGYRYGWTYGGACAEINGFNQVVRYVETNVCRRSYGTLFDRDPNDGRCYEYTVQELMLRGGVRGHLRMSLVEESNCRVFGSLVANAGLKQMLGLGAKSEDLRSASSSGKLAPALPPEVQESLDQASGKAHNGR